MCPNSREKIDRIISCIRRLRLKTIYECTDIVNHITLPEEDVVDFDFQSAKNAEIYSKILPWIYVIERLASVYRTLVPHVTPEMTSAGLMLKVNLCEPGPVNHGHLVEIPASFSRKRDGYIVHANNKGYTYMNRDPEVFFGKSLWQLLCEDCESPEETCKIIHDHDHIHDTTTHYILAKKCDECTSLIGFHAMHCRNCEAIRAEKDIFTDSPKKTKSSLKRKKKRQRRPLEPLAFEINADHETLNALGFVL